ncbi:MAG: hypothetical protein ABIM74_06360 [candidate division WOR-3 bacterium]
MPKRLEYILSSPVDSVVAGEVAVRLARFPGIREAVVEPDHRRLTALVDDGFSPEMLITAMESLGLHPQYQRASFFISPGVSLFAGAWIRRRFLGFNGVKDVKFNPLSRLLFVKYDRNTFDPRLIKKTLLEKGFSATETSALAFIRDRESKDRALLLRRLSLAFMLTVGIAVSEYFLRFRLAGILCLVCLLWPCLPIIRRAITSLFRGFLDTALLGILVAVSLFGHGVWMLFSGGMPSFTTASLVILLIYAWEFFEGLVSFRMSKNITEIVSRLSPLARVLRGGRAIEVSVDELEKGETLVVNKGERVPLDGIVIEGSGIIDGSPVSVGARLSATTRLESGWIKLRATQRFADSRPVKTLLLAEEAFASGSTSKAYITLITFAYGLLLASLVGAWFFWPGLLTISAMPLPQALMLATEWHRLRGVRKGFENGIIFKAAENLHRIARTNTLLVPLGSALGNYKIRGIEGSPDLIGIASSLEHGLFSKLSRAFGPAEFSAEQRTHHIEMGVTGVVGGVPLRFGNIRFVDQPYPVLGEDEGLFPVFLESEGPQGAIIFERKPRPGVSELMKAWKRKVMMSSASKATAAFWAKSWGIEEVYPEAVPEGKSQVLAVLLRKGGRVAYFDDLPHRHDLLRKSYWGIAISDDWIDLEAGTTAILGEDLSAIPLARKIAWRSNAAKWISVIMVFISALGLAGLWWMGLMRPEAFLISAYLLMFLFALV